MMKVMKLREMLKEHDGNAEVVLVLVDDEGCRIAPIGVGDTVIGKNEDGRIGIAADLGDVPYEQLQGDNPAECDEEADKAEAKARLEAILDRADARGHELPRIVSDDPLERADAKWLEEMREAKARADAQSHHGEPPNTPTGRTKIMHGDEFFEVIIDGESSWLPVHPDVVYGRTGEWRGWCEFLGNDDFEQVTQGMSEEEKAVEWEHCTSNKEEGRPS